MVFFVMVLKTRVVEIAGIRVDPDGEWMKQMARNLTDALDGFLRNATSGWDVEFLLPRGRMSLGDQFSDSKGSQSAVANLTNKLTLGVCVSAISIGLDIRPASTS